MFEGPKKAGSVLLPAILVATSLGVFGNLDYAGDRHSHAFGGQDGYLRYAQVGGTPLGGDEPSPTGEAPTTDTTTASVASTEKTQEIVAEVSPDGNVCEDTPTEYRLDCIAQSFRNAAKRMSRSGEYAEAREALQRAANELDKLVKGQRDRAKPRVRVRSTDGKKKQTRPLTAVKQEQIASTNRRAVEIIAEAETVLLRAASSDAKRAIHYQRIAAAVGSNKVLLRSV